MDRRSQSQGTSEREAASSSSPPDRKAVAVVPTKKWASPESWDRHRARITHLYTTEGKTLNEVMAIMASEHGHHATTRMYKSRIATWGLMKYKKEDDMMFVLRKKTRRDALGKSTSFAVRGREVSQQDIVEYFARKGGIPSAKKLGPEDPPTPTHIQYSSPPPSPTMMSHTLSPATLSRQPSPPQVFLSSEELFWNIGRYFDGSFGAAAWVADPAGNCINVRAGVSKVSGLEHLYSTAQTAVALVNTQKFIEARRILSRTCNMIQTMMTDDSEDPRSLEAIMQIFLLLKQHGMHQVITILQKYMVGIATTLGRNGGQERMWVKICRMVGQLDHSHLEDAIALAWRCTNDGFERNLGALHETSLFCYIDYIVWIHGSSDHETEEALLRDLLLSCQSENVFGEYSEMVLTITSRIAESLYKQKRYLEAETLGLDGARRARIANDQMQWMLGLEQASFAEHDMGKYELAEQHLREAIEVCEKISLTHPWVIKNRAKLEGWLREWGRHDEADHLRVQIDMLIGRDDIDAEVGEI